MARPSTSSSGSGGRLRPEPMSSRVARLVRRLLLSCLALIFFSAAGYCAWSLHHFIYQSGYFEIREIRIEGASDELKEEARAWLAKRIARTSDNLCRVSKRALEVQLGLLPRAKSVQVTKVYPGTLKVQFLQERTPVIVAQLEEPYLMDEEGVLLSKVKPARIHELRLPILTGIRRAYHRPGDRIKQDRLDDILETVRHIRAHEPMLHRMISEWNVNGRSEITAILNTCTEVRFGERRPIDRLDTLITALEQEKELENAQYIDLRIDRKLVYK